MNSRKNWMTVGILVMVLPFLGLIAPSRSAVAEEAEGEDLVLARVNGEEITLGTIRYAFGTRHSGHAGLLVGDEIIRRVVDKAVEEELLIQEGRLMGVQEEPGFDRAVEAYKDTLLLDAIEERFLMKASEATEVEVQNAYDLLPRQIRVGLIETSDEAAARAARLRVVGGEAFDLVARQVSTHRSRGQGGDLGWVTWGILDPGTERIVLETPVGLVSEPFEAEDGYRIVQVSEEKLGEPPAFEKVTDRLRAIIKSRKQLELKRSMLDGIREKHPPAVDQAALGKLLSSPEYEREEGADPPDEAIIMTTATGLPVAAGYIRERARKAGLSMDAAWEAGRDDALLIDEARRRIDVDAAIERSLELFIDQRVRAAVEAAAVSGLEITEEEARAVYEEDPNRFAGPPSYHIRHIVLSTREDAQEVQRLLEKGRDLGDLVRARSVDLKTKDKGGDLGWIDYPPGASLDETRQAIFRLKPGQFTDVMRTKLGYAIVQVLAIRPPLVPPFEEVRDGAGRILVSRKRAEMRDAFIATLKEHAEIELWEKIIARAIGIQDSMVMKQMSPGPEVQ